MMQKSSDGEGKRGNQRDDRNKIHLESSPIPYGYVFKSIGDKLIFPRDLLKKYCGHVTDVNVTCTYKNKCNFSHALFPSENVDSGISIIMDYVVRIRGLK